MHDIRDTYTAIPQANMHHFPLFILQSVNQSVNQSAYFRQRGPGTETSRNITHTQQYKKKGKRETRIGYKILHDETNYLHNYCILNFSGNEYS